MKNSPVAKNGSKCLNVTTKHVFDSTVKNVTEHVFPYSGNSDKNHTLNSTPPNELIQPKAVAPNDIDHVNNTKPSPTPLVVKTNCPNIAQKPSIIIDSVLGHNIVNKVILKEGIKNGVKNEKINNDVNNQTVINNLLPFSDLIDDDFKVEKINGSDICYVVTIRECVNDQPVVFNVGNNCINGTCQCVHYIGGVRTQLKPCRFFTELLLKGTLDPDWKYLLWGVTFGFEIINPDCPAQYGNNSSNIKSPIFREIINDKLLCELREDMLSVVPGPLLCNHSIFCVPKTDGGGRAIIDCSRPKNSSINAYTDKIAQKFKYHSVDDIASLMHKGDYMSTVDIKDAYRAIPINPKNRNRQGLCWKFTNDNQLTYLRDNRLCMGLASSPYIFSKVSDFLVRCAHRHKIQEIINYLDDFCLVSRDQKIATEEQSKFMGILRYLGFYINYTKLIPPSTDTKFLGIMINSETLEMRLPSDKLQKLRTILKWFIDRKKVRKKDLEKLAGLLAHCSKVVRGGRTFSRRIYDLMSTVQKSYYTVKLNKSIREDILWWAAFAEHFNGRSQILGKFAEIHSVYTDASKWGYGATYGLDWIVGSFDSDYEQALSRYAGHHYYAPVGEWSNDHINIQEMWGVFAAATTWAPMWKNKCILFITDSATVQSALSTGRSKCKRIMILLRKLFWLSVKHNFEYKAIYIRSCDNVVCDALSRLDKPSSIDRIKRADCCSYMCCSNIFALPLQV